MSVQLQDRVIFDESVDFTVDGMPSQPMTNNPRRHDSLRMYGWMTSSFVFVVSLLLLCAIVSDQFDPISPMSIGMYVVSGGVLVASVMLCLLGRFERTRNRAVTLYTGTFTG